ncbi:MAG: sigma-70 family RNA polymerase sigma factor [Planctomycetota bacterium]
MEPNDRDLIDDMNDGPPASDKAFEVLYARHAAWGLRVAARMTPDHGAARDVVQQAFLAFLEQFPGFRLRGELRSWLYQTIRFRALAEGRRARIRLHRHDAERSEAEAEPSTDDYSVLRAAVEDLEPRLREVLLMRVVDEMSVEATAAALGIPSGTVKSRLHRALRELRVSDGLEELFSESRPEP